MSLVCGKCGASNQEALRYCPTCGTLLQAAPVAPPASAIPPAPIPMGQPGYRPGAVTSYHVVYAGFWSRFAAALVDGILVGIVNAVAGGVVGAVYGGIAGASGTSMETIQATAGLLGMVVGVTISWLYFALMESSATQGTLGKLALGMKVTDLDGYQISFGKATGRFFGKYLSALILLIGYVMAGFTEKKQALHDILAGCLVVRK